MPSKTSRKRDVVQVRNPRSGHYVKIDRSVGRIVAHKKSSGPYKGVPVAKARPDVGGLDEASVLGGIALGRFSLAINTGQVLGDRRRKSVPGTRLEDVIGKALVAGDRRRKGVRVAKAKKSG